LALASAAARFAESPLLADDSTITVAAVGDCMITRRLSVLPPDSFLPVARILRGADVSFGNFEMTLADADAPPAYHEGCAYVHLRADMPENHVIADELKWAGFRMMGLANNHSMDYGAQGLLTTIRKFDAASLAHAGTGPDLAEARAPAYRDTAKGRVALVACASTFPYGALAADGNGEVAGRPGLDPLRVETTYRVEAARLEELRRIAASLGRTPPRQSSDGTFTFLGRKFVAGSPSGVLTAAEPIDSTAIVSSLRRARRDADLVLLGIHAHESGSSVDVPAQFLQPFAHSCIDAGGSAFIGHGPHVLRGIEIYKGCPIFYSLGNFIFHGESEKQIPPEIYQACGVSGNDPSDVFDKVLAGFSAGPFWVSVVALSTFRRRKLTELQLYPVSLQPELSRPRRGSPILADAETGRKVIEKLAELSRPYGTRIHYRDGIGVVDL
jgi:poly-gamma-glutamate capsule biosynthesis protein CapA/YwtB (metallophosphatase superfamily)